MEDNNSKADQQKIEPIIEVGGTKYIPLAIAEVEYYEQIKQPDGSILLKPYIIMRNQKEGLSCSPTANPTNPITPRGTNSKECYYSLVYDTITNNNIMTI